MQMKQRNLLTKTLMTFAIVFVMALVCGTQAKAATAPGQVTGVKQTDAGTGSVSLKWDASLANDVDYEVHMSTSKNGTYVCKEESTYGPDTSIYGLSSGSSYWVKVRAYVTDDADNKFIGAWSQPIEVITNLSSDMSTIMHTKSTYTSITLKWSAVPGANTYRVEYWRAGESSSTNKQKVTSGTSIELNNLSKNTEYSVNIYPGRKTANGSYVEYDSWGKTVYSIPVRPSKTSGLEVTHYWNSLAEMAVECDENKVADGYEWECYTAYKNRDTKIKSKSSSYNYAYLEKATLKKHYFFKVRVRAYCVDSNGNKYRSPWSSWKYVCQQPDVKSIKNSSKGQTISWDTIKGADRYALYMSTKKDSGYKKVATTKSTKKLITKFNKKKLKSGKKYYYYVVAYNKVGKKYYSGEAGNADRCWYKTYKK